MSAQGRDPVTPAPGLAAPNTGQAPGAFGISELREALPANGKNLEAKKPAAPPGWVEATPYDYNFFGINGAHDWDGNARVYEWDGEEGDVGPEHPELEIELFGEPGKRAKHGIDFSKYVFTF